MRIGDWSSDVCSSDLRVLRSRRFGHRDAVFLYGRLETREDTARLLGRIAHDLGDPLTQCDAPLLSKGARGVFAVERSEERSVGKECVSTVKFRLSAIH